MNENEKFLRSKFYDSIVAQSDLMDKLSERLFTLELAIPGVYATDLKLTRGDKATIHVNAAREIRFFRSSSGAIDQIQTFELANL